MQALPVLPHESTRLYLTDGGIETWLMYKKGFELPHFCSFHLLDQPAGREALQQYYREFALVAKKHGTPFIFCSMTYRASRDWGQLIGYSPAGLAEMNHKAFALYREIAAETDLAADATLYSGCIGPRGDAYDTHQTITASSAEDYHASQIETFKQAGAQLVTALTLNSSQEAIGIAKAAKAAKIPSVISFTLEKNARVGSVETLKQAIETVDAATNGAPAYYMINCSHPTDFGPALDHGSWTKRIRGLRANASSLDHGMLCQLGHLEEGDATQLAHQHGELAQLYSHINVLGGCCGTDHIHVDKICDAVQHLRRHRA